MSTPFFGKFNKSTKDFLDVKAFDLQRSVSLSTATSSGLTLTNKLKLSDSGAKGSLKIEGKAPGGGKADIEFNTGDLVEANYKSKELAAGVTVDVKAKSDKVKGNQECNTSATIKYCKEKLAADVCLDLVKPMAGDDFAELVVSASAAATVGKVSVGGNMKYKDVLQSYNAGLLYSVNDASFSVLSDKKFSVYKLGYFQKVNSTVTAGVTCDVAVNGTDLMSMQKSMAVAVERKLTSGDSLKAMVTKNYGKSVALHAMYTTQVNANAKLSLATKLDLEQMSGGNHTFGIKLALGNF